MQPIDLEIIQSEVRGRERGLCRNATDMVIDHIKNTPELKTLQAKELNVYQLLLLKRFGEEKAVHLLKLLHEANDTEDAAEFRDFLSPDIPTSHQFALAKDTEANEYYLFDVTLPQFKDKCTAQWYQEMIKKGFAKVGDKEFREYLLLRAKSPVHAETVASITLDWAFESQDLKGKVMPQVVWG